MKLSSEKMNKSKPLIQPEIWIKIGAIVLLMAGVGLVHWFNPALYPKLGYLLISGDIDAIAEFLRSYGKWAMAVGMAINILINMLGFFPGFFSQPLMVWYSALCPVLLSPG